MTKSLYLVGKTFGSLVVIEQSQNSPHGKTRWLCECDCGKRVSVVGACLVSGTTKSCGCLRSSDAKKRFETHGMSATSIYRIWRGMLTRCENPKTLNFDNYGGRGITVCQRWHKFENFYADMGDKPPGKSLDRINNDKGYSPKNCRWADRLTQSQNSRRPKLFSYDGITDNITGWAKRIGISQATLTERLKRGWPVNVALSTGPTNRWKRALSNN